MKALLPTAYTYCLAHYTTYNRSIAHLAWEVVAVAVVQKAAAQMVAVLVAVAASRSWAVAPPLSKFFRSAAKPSQSLVPRPFMFLSNMTLTLEWTPMTLSVEDVIGKLLGGKYRCGAFSRRLHAAILA